MAEKLFPTQGEGDCTRGSEAKKASRDGNKKGAKIMDGKTRYWVSSRRKMYGSCGFKTRLPTTADEKFHLGNHAMLFATADLN